MPESTAKEFEKEIENDPTIMRDLIEDAMKQKFLENPNMWEQAVGGGTSMRPPYEEWDNEPDGGRVYIQKEGNPQGFSEKYVHQIKK